MIAATVPLSAQLQFEELPKRHLPLNRTVLVGAVFADFDADGDCDLFVAGGRNGFPGPSRLYANDGTGVFAEVVPSPLPAQPATDGIEAVVAVDVDGDGDLDLVLANGSAYNDQQDRLWLNNGTGTFVDGTASRLPADSDRTFALAAGDVDGDGDLDLVFGGGGGQVRLYRNNGAGHFVDATANLPAVTGTTRGLALFDADGDGDLDLACANGFGGGQQNWLWRNNGAGVFSDVTAAGLPAVVAATAAVVAGDVDGDGDQDLVFADEYPAVLYLNQGAGTFVPAPTPLPVVGGALALRLADLDGDLDLDLVATWNYGQQLLRNSGSGTFADITVTNLPPARDPSTNLVVSDVDGDGDLDLACLGTRLRLYFNDGRALFRDGTALPLPTNRGSLGMAAGDLDGDGDADLVLVSIAGFMLLRNDNGWFTHMPYTMPPPYWANDVAIVDVDRDGRLDLVFVDDTQFGGSNRLLLNQGGWNFISAPGGLPGTLAEYSAVAAGDIDHDGDPDLVLTVGPWNATSTGLNQLLRNDGAGTFTDVTATQLPGLPDNTRAAAFADVDGDGDLDLVFANWRRQNRLWINDGTGRFTDRTAQQMPVDLDESNGVAVGDVDGDGDLDLVFANGAMSNEQSRLYRNDGTGAFTDVTVTSLPLRARYSSAVVLADVDADGDLDLVFANGYNVRHVQNELWLNDGTGTFRDATGRLPALLDVTEALLAADLDGDDDLDLVFANTGINPGDRICTNLLRQIDAPLTLRPGHGYRLDLSSRVTPAGQVDFGVPFLSLGPAHLPLPPFGTVGIDPTQMVQLPMVSIQGSARTSSVVVHVPRNAALVGLRVWSQALLLQPPWFHVTNVVPDQVIR